MSWTNWKPKLLENWKTIRNRMDFLQPSPMINVIPFHDQSSMTVSLSSERQLYSIKSYLFVALILRNRFVPKKIDTPSTKTLTARQK
jgi:hypothetical protein